MRGLARGVSPPKSFNIYSRTVSLLYRYTTSTKALVSINSKYGSRVHTNKRVGSHLATVPVATHTVTLTLTVAHACTHDVDGGRRTRRRASAHIHTVYNLQAHSDTHTHTRTHTRTGTHTTGFSKHLTLAETRSGVYGSYIHRRAIDITTDAAGSLHCRFRLQWRLGRAPHTRARRPL